MYLLLCKLIEYAQRRSWVWAVIESQIDTLGIIKSRDHLAAQGNQIRKILPKCRSGYCGDRARREMGEHLTPRPEPDDPTCAVFACLCERVHCDFVASGEGDSPVFFWTLQGAYRGPVHGVRSKHRMLNPSVAGPIASRVS